MAATSSLDIPQPSLNFLSVCPISFLVTASHLLRLSYYINPKKSIEQVKIFLRNLLTISFNEHIMRP
nr:MAG TPA: hypothetical protein [Caudoviricetes sp.]